MNHQAPNERVHRGACNDQGFIVILTK
jgi:hypothetical protein